MRKKSQKVMIGIIATAMLFGITSCGNGNMDSDLSPVEAGINVERVENLRKDFIGGVDISSYLALKNSGVKFYDYEGKELDDQGFFDLLAESGIDYVRIRVWNDPYDEEGHSYGGGNNDLDTAVKIGQWAANAGMKTLIDFHCSDFWADPGKQQVPKAWEGFSSEQKVEAVNQFVKESLKTLLDAGVDVGMVQIGNETNTQICGEATWDNICNFISAGSAAVRSVAKEKKKEIKVAVHFTNPETSGRYSSYAATLDKHNVDYDVFASSYYPFWHGSLENLQNVLTKVAETYGKEVMVAETSWCYTYEDGDGSGNTIGEGSLSSEYYDISVQGQADELRAVIQTVANIPNGIGVFYWEPAWIPVQVYDSEADNAAQVLAQNREIWEQYGSGWASSYAGSYDPVDAGMWYGGSAVDNQALFDFYGHPLESLKIFDYVVSGAIGPDAAGGGE